MSGLKDGLVRAIVIKSLPTRGFGIAKKIGSDTTYMIHKYQGRGFDGEKFNDTALPEVPEVGARVVLKPVANRAQLKAEVWGVMNNSLTNEELQQEREDRNCNFWMDRANPNPNDRRYKEDALIVAKANIPRQFRKRIKRGLLREQGTGAYRQTRRYS